MNRHARRLGAAAAALALIGSGALIATGGGHGSGEAFSPPSPMVLAGGARFSPAMGSLCRGANGQSGGGAMGVKQLASAYGLPTLYASGDAGARATIAVVEFARFRPRDVETFERCVGSRATVSTEVVDGGPPPARGAAALLGELEADVDVEELTALVPEAHIVVIEGAEGSAEEVLGTYDAAVNVGASVVSTSWGSCEGAITSGFAAGEAAIFQRAANLRETVVAASGDRGSADCYSGSGTSTGLAVDDPASQPDVLGVGGTAFEHGGRQLVWNEGTTGGASGGGISKYWQMPAYQSPLARRAEARAPAGLCPEGPTGCRAVPDVTADAGTPVVFYCSIRTLCSGWTAYGGTSVGAPLWASIFALADVNSACHGVRIGLANPSLYAIAEGRRADRAFSPVDRGNNNLFRRSGEFDAARGYNLASGLGVPIVGDGRDGHLVAQLCAAARSGSVPALPVTA